VNVLMVSPGYPANMRAFTRGLAAQGARVFGVGDQPEAALPPEVREVVTAHLHVSDLWDEYAVAERVAREASRVRIDRVECLWEPAMSVAARIRETLRLPGLSVEQTTAFRDKERMKQVLDGAGLRTPWHARAFTADQVRDAVGRAGFPVIIKPIAGAGSTDTHRIDSAEQLERTLPVLGHVEQVSVEEFIDGDELTYDTICAGGRILFENMSYYRTRPIEERKAAWISPSCVCLRDIEVPDLQGGRELGRRVLKAMGFRTGFTHMEWFRKTDGEVVFGEIAARPPGAHMVDAMNFASDIDLFSGWAEAVCHGRFTQPVVRRYNAAMVGKRAQGSGPIRAITGVEGLVKAIGPHIAALELPSIGAPAGNWRRAAPADGYVIVRHPDLATTLELAERVGRELQIYAG